MKIKISEILKQQGLFSQDIKTRIKNKQITINGEIVSDENFEIDCNVIKNTKKDITGIEFGGEVADVIDVGDFVFKLVSNEKWLSMLQIFGFENLFGETNIKNDLTLFLKDFILLKTSKKQIFVIKKSCA
jgi:hypothetical protein